MNGRAGSLAERKLTTPVPSMESSTLRRCSPSTTGSWPRIAGPGLSAIHYRMGTHYTYMYLIRISDMEYPDIIKPRNVITLVAMIICGVLTAMGIVEPQTTVALIIGILASYGTYRMKSPAEKAE